MQAIEEPRVRKWTKDEHYQMADLGWFRDQRAELVEGDIVVSKCGGSRGRGDMRMFVC
jgi:hypothetical protein